VDEAVWATEGTCNNEGEEEEEATGFGDVREADDGAEDGTRLPGVDEDANGE